jgi:prephenate dehydrogenase
MLPVAIDRVAAAIPRAPRCSTRRARGGGVTEALARASRRVRAVGGHPIAGNERKGLTRASAQLFHGATFALLPIRGGVPPVVRRWCARSAPRRASSHRSSTTARSHASATCRGSSRARHAKLGAAAARERLAGPGYASMTRLAASDPRMSRAYTRANATNVRVAWRKLRAELDREVRALSSD